MKKSYLPVSSYTFESMTPEEKRVLLSSDILEPIVIRGMYKPKAKDMDIDELGNMFGDHKLRVETYNDGNYDNLHESNVDTFEISFPDLLNYFKFDHKPFMYLADFDVLTELKGMPKDRLKNLVKLLSSPATENLRTIRALFLYVGKDSRSNLHMHIESDFILNQLYGSKTVYIFGNYDNDNISKRSVFQPESNYAKQNFFELDHSKMKIYKTTLHPGDSLLIPPWAWHAARGHGVNFSVTQVFERSSIAYLLTNPNLILENLFDMVDPLTLFSAAVFMTTVLVVFMLDRTTKNKTR